MWDCGYLCLHFDQLATLHDDTARKYARQAYQESRRSIRNFETHLTSKLLQQFSTTILNILQIVVEHSNNDTVQKMTSQIHSHRVSCLKQRLQLRKLAKLHLQFDLLSWNNNIFSQSFIIALKSLILQLYERSELCSMFTVDYLFNAITQMLKKFENLRSLKI